jgi:hypothetical protein
MRAVRVANERVFSNDRKRRRASGIKAKVTEKLKIAEKLKDDAGKK